MVITQKVTSLAYSIHDGLARKEEELTPLQRRHAVYKMPNSLEFFSYVFHFQALMAGPVIFYSDYMDFIYGKSAKSLTGCHEKKSSHEDDIVLEPSPVLIVMKKICVSVMCALVFVTFIPMYPIQILKDDEFIEGTSNLYKVWYLLVVTMLVRFKYYHAWIFADAICNNSGLGFNGYDEKGNARWDLVSNVDGFGFETALSLRDAIDSWNLGTNRWLRSIAYERAGPNKMLFTYALSAIWHGFYPGYYLTFASGAFFTVAGRSVRRHVRPYFLGSRRAKFFYDVLTMLTTRIVLAYFTFSFILLEFIPSIRLLLKTYLLPHLLALVAIYVLPKISKLPSKSSSNNGTPHNCDQRSNGNSLKTD
ncbi:lysophospholipid acyltransferase 6 [Prorops nasuta]|uniref:lysophospholipid acyltransferase 6 n=1 Tax=Prorops nasuta TaxID=863751 RepID=UPI0034CEA8EF